MTQQSMIDRNPAPIIPPELAIKAMMDGGYKNTAYALAELIDNAVQAGAANVDVICLEEVQGQSRRLHKIGVLDNGNGMEPFVLQLALQFGNGTHLDDRKGMGRFGMGLPNSSISQCRRVDVWTWQNGPDNAMHTYLDVGAIERGSLKSVPFPSAQPLPLEWRSRSDIVTTTGTMVVWSELVDHKVTWRGARATLTHTGDIVGRMYRHFINDGHLTIGLLAYRDDTVHIDEFVKVNDPLYLMRDSSTPSPFNGDPMFQKWGDEDEAFTIELDGVKNDVTVRMSWARPETVPNAGDRGSQPYGKHANKNTGVSIVREGRELDLDRGWTISYEPTERWWGIEVNFPSALDEIFGVTNNKQSATVFSGMSHFDWMTEAEDGESRDDFIKRIHEQGDPRSYLIPILEHIKDQIGQVRTRLSEQTKGRRGPRSRHEVNTVADVATTKYRERADQGHSTDADAEVFTEQDRDKFEENLRVDKNYSGSVALAIANGVLIHNRKVEFLTKGMDGYAFFDVEHQQGGLTTVVFNTKHALYEKLIAILEPDIEEESDAQLLNRINEASDTLKLLFAAWARYHLEDVPARDGLYDVRQKWGEMARFILNEPD